MDPYRDAALRCPNCPETSLREFQHRLVCDECRGLLIAEPDFASACADLAGRDVTLTVAHEKPTTTPCPKCERAMSSCDVGLDGLRVKVAVLRCDRDGLWLETDLLAGVFALIARRIGGVTGSSYYAPPRRTGLDGVARGAEYGGASSGLQISHWHDRPRRRSPTVTPINVYQDQALPCPACKTTALRFACDRWTCATCAGTFMQNAALEAMVLDMSQAPWSMPLPTGEPGERACPVCAAPMLVETVEGVTLDRCAPHGLWFDARELTIALEHASHQFDAHGIRGWLEKLFA